MDNKRKSRSDHGHDKEGKEREFDTELKKQDQHKKDADIAEKTLSSIDSAGTKEGHDRRAKAADSADSAVKREAAKLEQAERKISKEGQGQEKQLDSTAKSAGKDHEKLKAGAGKVQFDLARKELEKAAEGSKDDQQWLDKTKQEQEKVRTKADSRTDKFGTDIKSKNMGIKG